MQRTTESSYDEFPYPSVPLRWTHPDQISTVAALFGMRPATVDSCRVLEIGCADGANLIPMAANLPGSRFTGLDLSSAHIRSGMDTISRLNLHNVTLHHMNVMNVDDAINGVAADGGYFGEFDFIIAYGIFSWVPPEVQNKILQVCRQHLSPQGVAFISYNVYPGWHMRGAVREMLLYHTRRFDDRLTRVQQARALLRFLAEATPKVVRTLAENKAYSMMLDAEQQRIVNQSDSYILHELLEEYNEPFYFHQFAERASAFDLQYLSESELSTMLPDLLPPDVADAIGRLGGNIVATEQYLDFVRNRMFRQTLLCRKDVRLERTWGQGTLRQFHLSSAMKPVSDAPVIQSPSNEKFRQPNGTVVSSANPLIKAGFLTLSQKWPNAVSFNSLLIEARDCSHSTAPLEADAQTLEDTLLKTLAVDLVELSLYPPRFTTLISERPCASAVARHQATRNGHITNQRHEVAVVDELGRRLIPLLDGCHTLADLAADITERPASQHDEHDAPSVVLEQKLRELANTALLVA